MSRVKYRLSETDTIITADGTKLRRVISLSRGGKGGYIECEANLSHYGTCWVGDDAQVYGGAKVLNHALVCDKAKVFEQSVISGSVMITGTAQIRGKSRVQNYAAVADAATVSGNSLIKGTARVCDQAVVADESTVQDSAVVGEFGMVRGKSIVRDKARIYGSVLRASVVAGTTYVYAGAKLNRAIVSGDSYIHGRIASARVDNSSICANTRVGDTAQIKNSDLLGRLLVTDDAKINDSVITGAGHIGRNARLNDQRDYFMACGVGSKHGHLVVYRGARTLMATRGCFMGTVAQFLKAVKETHGDSAIAREYQLLIEVAKSRILGGSIVENHDHIAILSIIKAHALNSSGDVKNESRIVEDLGIDSLERVKIVMALEEEFNISIDDEDARSFQTVQDYINHINKAI